MPHKHLALVSLVLVLGMLACALPGPTTLSPEDQIATQVAATLTAAAPVSPEIPAESPVVSAEAPVVSAEPPEPVLRIVYTDGGNVWLIEGDGPAVQVTSSGGAERVLISGDGEKIAFLWRAAPEGRSELRAVNADGTGETTLLTAGQLDALYPPAENILGTDISAIDFIPGTHTLVFNTYAIPEFIGLMMHDDLLTVDADTGVMGTLLAGGSGGDFAVSPDGSQIAVVTSTSIALINSDGSGLRPNLVTFPMVITYSEFLFYPLVVWSPDSSALGAAIPSNDPLIPTPSGSMWRIPADGSPATLVGTISGHFYFSFWRNSALSPNLNRVAFTRPTATVNVDELYIANADGSDELAYVDGITNWQGWAPDSSHFVYSDSGTPASLILGEVGTMAWSLGPGTDVRWISDSEFLFVSGTHGAYALSRGDLGGATTALAYPAGNNVWFDFTR